MISPEALDPAVEEEWRRLRAQLDLAAGFWLGFAFLTSPGVSQVFEQRVGRILRQHARKSAVIQVTAPSDIEDVMSALLAAKKPADCVWVDCVHAATADWDQAIWRLFLRLNERRDAIRRRLPGGLVFALHPSMKPRVREAAPDLWSVRSLVLEPASVPPLRVRREELELRERDIDLPVSGTWPQTQVSVPGLRKQLGRVARLLDTDRAEEAVEAANHALAQVTADTTAADVIAALTWASRAAEAADDDGAATDHAGQALSLLPAEERNLRRELLGRIARLAEGRQDFEAALSARHALVAMAQAALNDAPTGAQQPSDFLPQMATALVDEGDVLHSAGDLDAAAAAYTEALQLCRHILDAYGETPTALRDLSISLERVGDVARDTGDLSAARTAYTEALQLRRHILDAYGETPTALRDLSISLNKVGDVASDTGDLTAAHTAHTESLHIARRILDAYGETPTALRDLSISLEKVGDVASDTGDPAAARTAHTEALQLRRHILDAYGETPTALRDLSISLNKVGNLARDTGDLTAARTAYTESLHIARRILDAYGETPTALRDLAIALEKCADVDERSGNAAAAEAAREEARAVRERLA